MFHQNNISSFIPHPELPYWQSKLDKIAPLLDFPTDRVRKTVFDAEAKIDFPPEQIGQVNFDIPQDLTQALKEIAQATNISLSVVLLAAFQVLLHRYTNQEDLVVGCVDWYVDLTKTNLEILPIRVKVSGQQTFLELLSVVAADTSQASDCSGLSLESLTTGLTASNPEFPVASLFQMLYRFNSLSSVAELNLTAKIPKRELFLDITEQPEHLIAKIEYERNLFDAVTIQRIADNYQVLLKSIIANPQTAIASVCLLSTAERQQVLVEWNKTQVERETKCIHQLFEARVAQNPEAVAVACQGEQLTYRELNQKANQVAHYLQSLGIGQESRVGLYLDRSVTMVVGLFGILKAGAAYVPLDLGNPQPRQAYIIEDTGISILLTQASLLEQIPSQIETSICLDRDWDVIAQYSQDNCPSQVTSSNLALIIYTSGSTGKPKGVIIAHSNLSHYARAMQLSLNMTSEDVYLHRGQIALIASARQLLTPLTLGGAVVILTDPEKRDPFLMFDLIKRYGVTIVDRVPSFWRSFSDILRQLDAQTRQNIQDNKVRLVATSGEQVNSEVYNCWRDTFAPHTKFANLYGQTEGTGIVTVYHLPEEFDNSFKSSPVGSPVANMQIYLLDEYLEPVPIGVVAEIHISGGGVAQGYLNRPELTAKKFIENPYVSGNRLYKTGDLGRYLSDGSIQFLGRMDHQVNIQGLRIELGEIETVLAQHELVQEAAVVVKEGKLGETLTVFVIPSKTEPPTETILRSYLREKLPPYMIPNSFGFVDSFPLTTSGKVNRLALSTLDLNQSSAAVIAPRDRVESEIVEMLAEILDVKEISIQDDFLELGGNSLLAARLVTEIENKYQQKIPVSSIFQASTPETLADLIRREGKIDYPKSFVPIKQGNSQPILFGIHNLGYGLELYRPMAKYFDADISFYGLASFLSDEPNKPHPRDIMGLASYYTQELLKVQPQGSYHLIGVSFGGVIAYEIAQKLVAQGKEVKFLGLVDTFFPNPNSIYKTFSLEERLTTHINKIRAKGASYILNRVKWRTTETMDNLRGSLYQIDWVRENFVDETSRNFSQAKYIQQKREHQQVNRNYKIEPYPGQIDMFRAADDLDPKLDWQDMARSGLSIYDIPGEHLEIIREPNVQILGEQIQSVLLSRQ